MRENLNPSTWGPCAWTFMEAMARGLDAGSRRSFERFLELLPDLLPCEACRQHSRVYVDSMPLGGCSPVRWVQDFRSHVQKQRPRPDGTFDVFLVMSVAVGLLLALARAR